MFQFKNTRVNDMKTLIGAALGALMLTASPASAQLYKAGTVTATLRNEKRDQESSTRRDAPVVLPFYKAGVPTFVLQVPAGRGAPSRVPEEPRASPPDANPGACCHHHKGGNAAL